MWVRGVISRSEMSTLWKLIARYDALNGRGYSRCARKGRERPCIHMNQALGRFIGPNRWNPTLRFRLAGGRLAMTSKR